MFTGTWSFSIPLSMTAVYVPESTKSVLFTLRMNWFPLVSILYLADGCIGVPLKSQVILGRGKPSTSNAIWAFCVCKILTSLGVCFNTSGAKEKRNR